ncbi:MAG TPA: hypothetical protein VJ550_13255 [Geomonas sp.]|nr:hypothetical protein [Geomonas sp.]
MKLVQMLRAERGIALVTSLMLTFLSLLVVMTAMYLLTVATRQSGTVKNYKTALQASYGGSDLVMKDLIPQLLMNGDALSTANSSTVSQIMQGVAANFPGLSDLAIGPDYSSQSVAAACITAKLTSAPPWLACPSPTAGVSSTSVKPKELPDFKFTVPSAAGAAPFTVYSKIVDTTPGNSDMSGVSLQGAGVADSQNAITPQHIPYVFRVEVQAERSSNPNEKSNLSLLYAY